MNKAIFIDKDGTLIPNIPYNVDPGLVTLNKNAGETLRNLQQQGYLIVVVSNQAGVAKGMFKEEQLERVKTKLEKLLLNVDVILNGFYYCPHHNEGVIIDYAIDCNCRKPKAGMIQRAIKKLNIDPHCSWMIGDILNDVEAGKRAFCKSILFDCGNETEWNNSGLRKPDFIAKSFKEIEQIISNHTFSHTLI